MTDGQPANISYSLQENKGAEMDVATLSYDELLKNIFPIVLYYKFIILIYPF